MADNDTRSHRKHRGHPRNFTSDSSKMSPQDLFYPIPEDIADPFSYLKSFAKIGPRPSCSLKEREAASFVKKALAQLGFETHVQAFSCNPSMFRPHILIFLITVAMGAFHTLLPQQNLGLFFAAIGCFLAYQLYADLLQAKQNYFTKILPKRASQNIIGKWKPTGKVKNRIVLMSHLDSALCSPIFGEKMVRNLKSNIKIDRVLFVTMGLLYLASAFTGNLFPYYGALLLSIYILGSIFVLLYSELFSPYSPGVNDNASGVSTVLAMAEGVVNEPLENTELWCVFTGAEEPGIYGSHALWERYGSELRESYIINLNAVGAGNPRYVINEGYSEEYKSDSDLIRILEDLSLGRSELNLSPVMLKSHLGFTDCTHLLRMGCHGITLMSTTTDGLIKNWHTPKDTVEGIDSGSIYRALETLDYLVRYLDRDYSSLTRFAPRKRISHKKIQQDLLPTYRILDAREIRSESFQLDQYLWPDFDKQAQYIFDQSAFLQCQAKSLSIPNGFIILEQKPNEPIGMIPYFVYQEMADDGAASYFLWKIARVIRKCLLRFHLPVGPGFKTLFLGSPFAQPSNKFFLKKGLTLEDLMEDYPDLIKVYKRALVRLQVRHLAPVISHFIFEKNPRNENFFKALDFQVFPSWPDMFLDFQKISRRLRDRVVMAAEEAHALVRLHETRLEELKIQELDLIQDLEEDPNMKSQIQAKHMLLEDEEKQLLLAADAQNQIDKLNETLVRGKYIETLMKKKRETDMQTEKEYPGFSNIPIKIRLLLSQLFDLDGSLKEARKKRDRCASQLKKTNEKIEIIIKKSLINKFSGILPEELNECMEFFMVQEGLIRLHSSLPEGWFDITVEDVLRRLHDLKQMVLKRDEESSELEKTAQVLKDINERFNNALERLNSFNSTGGKPFLDQFNKLLRAEKRMRESKELENRVHEERRFYEAIKDQVEVIDRGQGTPEREKIGKAIASAAQRREQAILSLGIIDGWKSLPEAPRKYFKKLAKVRLSLRRTDHSLKEAIRTKRKAEFDLSQKEFDYFDKDYNPTFDEYVESLGVNNRNAIRRNLKKIQATEKEYLIEVVTDPKAIRDLADELYRAYQGQYNANRVQWVKLTPEFFRDLENIPNVEVLVCWHLVDLNTKKFAGFIVNLDHQFNHRMGIMPEYRHGGGQISTHEIETERGAIDDDHLIYFRLTLKNIEMNLNSGKPGMWIAQTTYGAKDRLGFEFHPLYSYRRSTRWFGFHYLSDSLYRYFMKGILDPEILYRF